MKKFTPYIAFITLVILMPFYLGCGGGSDAPTSVSASSSVKVTEPSDYDQGLSFAAPEDWEMAKRQSKIIVKFDNPNLEGQSVFVKMPVPSEIKTLATPDDASASGLTGEMVKVGEYYWMRSTNRSRDSKTEDKFDNLNCATIQFGKVFTVTVRGYENTNDNAEAIMQAVLSNIKFSEAQQVEEIQIDENTDFSVDF